MRISSCKRPCHALADHSQLLLPAADHPSHSYQNPGRKAVWNSQTGGRPGCGAPHTCKLIFQTDGNFVEYYDGVPVWNTGTYNRGQTLAMQNTVPYMYIVDKNGAVIWHT